VNLDEKYSLGRTVEANLHENICFDKMNSQYLMFKLLLGIECAIYSFVLVIVCSV